MATIRKRANGSYQAIVRQVGFAPQSKTFPTKREAQEWGKQAESGNAQGNAVDHGSRRKGTVRALLERFRDEECPHRRGGDWETFWINRRLREDAFPLLRLDQDVAGGLRKFIVARGRQVKPGTVVRDLSFLGGVFTHAIKVWGTPLVINPVHLVKKPSAPRGRETTWSPEDVAKLFKQIGPVDFPPRQAKDYLPAIVELAIETAMRQGEIRNFTKQDCHLDEAWLRLDKTKNGDARDVPLSKRAIEIIRPFAEIIETGSVFPLGRSALQTSMHRATKGAGLVDMTFHDTRHTAATNLSRKLSNVLELSAVTGHRNLQSLKRYYNPKAADLAAKLG
jgi:integrase